MRATMVTTRVLWAILALFLATASLEAGLMAPQSLVTLQRADLIINADASQIVQNGTTVNFSLNVIRVIKGNPALVGTSIAASWTSGDQSYASNNTGGGGIWFLRQVGNAWRVIPVIQGAMGLSDVYFPAPSNVLSAYAYSQSATSSEKLASEICSAIESSSGYSFQVYALERGLLDKLQSPIVELLYTRMANSASSEHKLVGLSGLIRSGNSSALITAIQTESAAKGSFGAGILLSSIRDYFRAADAKSVAALGAAATDSSNPNTAFREAAAHALAGIHTSAALPFLATLLDDPDLNLRVEAGGGMGAFANGLPMQTMAGVPSLSYLQVPASASYKTAATVAHLAFGVQAIAANEASYLSFWKAWWSQNRGSLGY